MVMKTLVRVKASTPGKARGSFINTRHGCLTPLHVSSRVSLHFILRVSYCYFQLKGKETEPQRGTEGQGKVLHLSPSFSMA